MYERALSTPAATSHPHTRPVGHALARIASGTSNTAASANRSAAASNVGYPAPRSMQTRIAYHVVPQISAQTTYAATSRGTAHAAYAAHAQRSLGGLLLVLLAVGLLVGLRRGRRRHQLHRVRVARELDGLAVLELDDVDVVQRDRLLGRLERSAQDAFGDDEIARGNLDALVLLEVRNRLEERRQVRLRGLRALHRCRL